MTARHGIALVSLSGAVGGMLNACLCYARWPAPVQESNVSFHWHIIPAGLAHGGLLALAAMAGAVFAASLGGASRWAAVPVVGWLGGYVSWIPLDMSAFGNSFMEALAWPVVGGTDSALSFLWEPFFYFGVVSALLYAWLIKRRKSTPRWADVAAACCAGAVGSLWWWSAWGPWYFSPLHGGVWGCFVGWAVSRPDH